MTDSLDEQQEQRIYQALYAGRTIEAIKLHREATGSGLKESKDFIDALEAQLRNESPEMFTAQSKGCATTVMVLAAPLVAAVSIPL